MRKLLLGSASLLLIILTNTSSAQKTKSKFSDVKPEDFATKVYGNDSTANAVVLFDIGSSHYEGDSKGGFSVIFKRHTRIRILNRNAFDVATVSIPMYASGTMEEKVEQLSANTYNLENGKVEATKLDAGSIFKEKISKNYTARKFTMPNLKEGCIVDINYTFSSPYERYLRDWQFQREYPVLFSEYKIAVPTIYDFVSIRQGYHPFLVDKAEMKTGNFSILNPGATGYEKSEVYSFRSNVIHSTWAMENIPALKKEDFTTNIENHVAKIEFQLSKIQYPNSEVKNVMNTWQNASEELLKDPDFGEGLAKGNGWMDDELKKISAGVTDRLEMAKKVYAYVRDNFTCTNHSRYYLTNPLKKTFQTKSGSVADINLLLIAMLKQKGFDVKPVLLSTRDHRKAFEAYPIMDRLNYVIGKLVIDEVPYLLDASYTRLGFGKLTNDCYNGYARIIDTQPVLLNLSPDSLQEAKMTSVYIINDQKQGLKGSYASMLGYEQSYDLREKFGKGNQQDLFKAIKKSYSFDVEMANSTIDSLTNYEEPVTIKYDFNFKPEDEILYLNPIFTEVVKENPFKAAERFYPVEMPYQTNEMYVLKMEIPKGYKVEELPKSARVMYNENEGMFEYLITATEGLIQLRTILRFKKATFEPDEYQTLRDFYAMVVKKNSEQIVLKKIDL